MGLLSTVKETVVGDEGQVGTEAANERERPASSNRPESEADFVIATGRTRKEFLLELVEACDGQVKQVDLVNQTGWSKATVSRQLSELENEGAIDRVRIGRCKVVLLPGKSLMGDHTVSSGIRR